MFSTWYIRIAYCLISFIWLMDSYAYTSRSFGVAPNFQHLMGDGSESIGEIYSLYQDSYGFVWAGGVNGLARHDGYRFHIYRIESGTGLLDNFIRHIFEDRENNLWVASQNGGVMRLDRKTDTFVPVMNENKQKFSIQTYKILENYNGDLLLLTADGFYQYDKKQQHFVQLLASSDFSEFRFFDVVEIAPGEFLIGLFGGGVLVWNREENQSRVYAHSPGSQSGPPHNMVRSVFKTSRGIIIVGTAVGPAVFDKENESFVLINYTNVISNKVMSTIRGITETRSGEVLFSTDGDGLVYCNATVTRCGHLDFEQNNLRSLGSSVVRTILEDDSGDFWIGLFPKGIDYYNSSNTFFKSYTNIALSEDGNVVNSIWDFEELNNGDLLLGTDGGGVAYFDKQSNSVNNERLAEVSDYLVNEKGAVLSLKLDSRNNLWLGYWKKGLTKIDLNTGKVSRYIDEQKAEEGLPSGNVWALFEDSNHNLWIGTTSGGLIRYVYDEDVFVRYGLSLADDSENSAIWTIYEDSYKQLWFGSNGGAVRYDPINDEFTSYVPDENQEGSLSHNMVFAFYEDYKGNFWLGTGGGGLNKFDRETEQFSVIQKSDGIASNTILEIEGDSSANMWLATDKGLSLYDSETKTAKNYSIKNWLQSNIFNIASGITLSSGELAFGGDSGLTLLKPISPPQNKLNASIYITEIEVNDKKVRMDNNNSILDSDILTAQSITLDYQHNVLMLAFTILNYRIYENNQFLYRLKGFDNQWRGPTSKNRVTYTNLDAGEYVFEVQASNHDGVWSEEVKRISITVLSPPWLTWWAYCLYALCFLGVASWYLGNKNKIIRLQSEVVGNLQYIDQLKNNFIASISHELRTPVFGIIGLAEELRSETKESFVDEGKAKLDMILASGNRLHCQIEDILDFSNIQANKFSTNLQPCSVYDLVELLTKECRVIVESKGLRLENNVSPDCLNVLADERYFQHVLLHLIENAIRFTDDGKITIWAEPNSDRSYVDIHVSDSGKGVAEDVLDGIFEMFNQLDHANTRVQGGTGIGLCITKKLVELHGGTVWVESQVNKGSTFSFSLRSCNEKVSSVSKLTERTIRKIQFLSSSMGGGLESILTVVKEKGEQATPYDIEQVSDSEPLSDVSQLKVLIVDDEPVNRAILKAYAVKLGYDTVEAKDGSQALELINQDDAIAIVLLDIMMPGLSGYDVCLQIRKWFSDSQMRVIFVSAKASLDSQERAFEVGGNAYLTKPVSMAQVKQEILTQLDKLDFTYRRPVSQKGSRIIEV